MFTELGRNKLLREKEKQTEGTESHRGRATVDYVLFFYKHEITKTFTPTPHPSNPHLYPPPQSPFLTPIRPNYYRIQTPFSVRSSHSPTCTSQC